MKILEYIKQKINKNKLKNAQKIDEKREKTRHNKLLELLENKTPEETAETISSLLGKRDLYVYDLSKLPTKYQKIGVQEIIKTARDYPTFLFGTNSFANIFGDKKLTEIALAQGLNANGCIYSMRLSDGGGLQMTGCEEEAVQSPYLLNANTECSKLLLQHGADPDARYISVDCSGIGEGRNENICILEKALKEPEKVSLLLQYGADPFLVKQELNEEKPAHKLILEARKKGKEYYVSNQARIDAVQKYVISPIKEEILSDLKKQMRANKKSKFKKAPYHNQIHPKIKKHIRANTKYYSPQDSLENRINTLKAKLGDKVGKTADTTTGSTDITHFRIATTQTEISKEIIKKKRKSR